MHGEMKLYEARRERNPAFPFYMYKLECREGASVIYAHWHEEVEILYAACSGSITVEGTAADFAQNDIIFVNKGRLHHAGSASKGLLYVLVFDYDCLEFRGGDFCQTNIIERLKDGRLFFPLRISETDELHAPVRDCLLEMVRLYSDGTPGRELKIKCCLYEIIFLLYSAGRLSAGGKAEPACDGNQLSYVKAAIRYMEENHPAQLTVDDIARSVSISKYHFIKTFRQITGMTPIHYLRDLRIEKSVALLKAGHSITQTAYSCGFNNLSYYIRAFRQRHGVSPRAFQKQEG